MNCQDCKHWRLFRTAAAHSDQTGEGDLGTCHRYPPTLDPSEAAVMRSLPTDSSLAWVQPVTEAQHHCGEFASHLPWPLHRFAWSAT